MATQKTQPRARRTTKIASPKSAVGVRLSPEDQAFLKDLSPNATPSDAIRTLISQARANHQKPVSVSDAQARIMELLGGCAELRTEAGARSVVIEDLVREAVLVVATALVGPPQPGLNDPAARQAYEALIVDRAFDFLEATLRHTLADKAPAWDPDVIRARLAGARQTLVMSLAATSPTSLPRAQG